MSNIVAQFRESTLIDTAIPDIKYREELKAKKAELKKLNTELSKLEEQKAEVEAREAEEAKKAELEETIQKLMADGMSAGGDSGEVEVSGKLIFQAVWKIINKSSKISYIWLSMR